MVARRVEALLSMLKHPRFSAAVSCAVWPTLGLDGDGPDRQEAAKAMEALIASWEQESGQPVIERVRRDVLLTCSMGAPEKAVDAYLLALVSEVIARSNAWPLLLRGGRDG